MATLTGALPAFAANFTHVVAILANDLPAFTAGLSRLIAAPFMRNTLAVRCAATFTGNSFLFFRIHGGKTTIRRFAAGHILATSVGRIALSSQHYILLWIARTHTTAFLLHSALVV